MKTIRFVGLLGLLTIAIFSSCKKDGATDNNVQSKEALSKALSQKLSEFEIIELDINTLNSALKNDASQKNLVLIPEKYEFQLEAISSSEPIEIYNEETDTKEYLDLKNTAFDNLNTEGLDKFASFTWLDSKLHGQFEIDGNHYKVTPTSEYVDDAPAYSYVIYKDVDARNDLVTDEDLDDGLIQSLDIEEMTDEVLYSEMPTSANSPMASTTAKRLKVNLFTDTEFRKTFKGNLSQCASYMVNTINHANAKYRRSNMPVQLVAGNIYHMTSTQIPYNSNIATLNNITFQNFLNKNKSYNGPANILFTDKTIKPACTTAFRVCKTHYVACSTIRYQPNEFRRDNFTAHELAHMMGCKHKKKGTYPMNIMWGYPPAQDVGFRPETRTEMAKYIGNRNACLY